MTDMSSEALQKMLGSQVMETAWPLLISLELGITVTR